VQTLNLKMNKSTHLARGVIDDGLLEVLQFLAGRGLHLERNLQRAQQKRGDLRDRLTACARARKREMDR
jgi:hypothetical protein